MYEMFVNYLKELDAISSFGWDDFDSEAVKLYESYKDYEIKNIEDKGFVIYDIDYFDGKKTLIIEQAYVKPAHRKKGYMKSAIDFIMSLTKPDQIGMMVIKKNKTALKFWKGYFKEYDIVCETHKDNVRVDKDLYRITFKEK